MLFFDVNRSHRVYEISKHKSFFQKSCVIAHNITVLGCYHQVLKTKIYASTDNWDGKKKMVDSSFKTKVLQKLHKDDNGNIFRVGFSNSLKTRGALVNGGDQIQDNHR
ncbi:hypothetical protein CDAR_418881 [Caerostris darwini]|uniref:Uncharacterized protein n=1 Tax=Caerostris darwini TaxID=1538125 RepID=A0AAV4MWQ8_9ARAC|nr:hypothetical protein CDAR_418881 [Caerostris darwini]